MQLFPAVSSYACRLLQFLAAPTEHRFVRFLFFQGKRWSSISKNLPGRTPSVVRRRLCWLKDPTEGRKNQPVSRGRVPKAAGTSCLGGEHSTLADQLWSSRGSSEHGSSGDSTHTAGRVKQACSPPVTTVRSQGKKKRVRAASAGASCDVGHSEAPSSTAAEEREHLGSQVQQREEPCSSSFSSHGDNCVASGAAHGDASSCVYEQSVAAGAPSEDYLPKSVRPTDTGLDHHSPQPNEPLAPPEKERKCPGELHGSDGPYGQQQVNEPNPTLKSLPGSATPPTEICSCSFLSGEHSRCSSSPSLFNTSTPDEQQPPHLRSPLPNQPLQYALDSAELYLIDLEVSSLEHELLSPVLRSVLHQKQLPLPVYSPQLLLVDQHVSGAADEFMVSTFGRPPYPHDWCVFATSEHPMKVCSKPELTLVREKSADYRTAVWLTASTDRAGNHAEFLGDGNGCPQAYRSALYDFPLLQQFEEAHIANMHEVHSGGWLAAAGSNDETKRG